MPETGFDALPRVAMVNACPTTAQSLPRGSRSGTLAYRRGTWHSGFMVNQPPSRPGSKSQAGGFLIAAGAMLGASIGFLLGQATPGFLIGAGSGIAFAVAIWLVDRRR